MSGEELSLLRSALDLAGRGWHVFPCTPGAKRPVLRGNWQELATTDPGAVRRWWHRAPYNIGIACGPSGLIVLDLDVACQPHTDGAAGSGGGVLAALCERHRQPYPLPTYAVSTPSGGAHLYYTSAGMPVRNSAGRLGPLVDVRAAGGYVVGAGSSIGAGRYTERDRRQPAPLPAWIAMLATREPGSSAGQRPPAPDGPRGAPYALAALREETRLVAAARPGTRNDTLNRAAFSLGQLTIGGLLAPLTVTTALADAACRAGLPADEARRTIRSGMAAGAAHPRAAVPAARVPDV
jgi:Bifunctional DNA primase/polymerase, N-terminal